ncbi:hypothetical protein [Lelliottia wanjuensis]|uniref:hypothetical protein n=1 Tax=Lelliottia wanjuensis TaxID=3050585 RepID=UPI00254E1F39|nr:hypothetical protein [Lelliottia sp. V106_16]MDK9356721.1 hypothetical protein [Lelliottia sp. V106_16]
MFKNLFRHLAGGRAQPKIVFTCRGINSELVAVVDIRKDLQWPLVWLLNLPGVDIKSIGWRTLRITSVANTQELSRVHNKLLSRGLK